MGALGNLSCHDVSYCRRCKLAKVYALPLNQSSISLALFDLIHFNVWGLAPLKEDSDIIFHLLMIILLIAGFIF